MTGSPAVPETPQDQQRNEGEAALTALDLSRLEARIEEATAAPWFAASREDDDESWWIWADAPDRPFTVALLAFDGPDETTDGEAEEADAQLIVALRNAAPSLIAAARAARKAEADLRATINGRYSIHHVAADHLLDIADDLRAAVGGV